MTGKFLLGVPGSGSRACMAAGHGPRGSNRGRCRSRADVLVVNGKLDREAAHLLRPTCYCPQREHGNRRETAVAPPDASPHLRHAARR